MYRKTPPAAPPPPLCLFVYSTPRGSIIGLTLVKSLFRPIYAPPNEFLVETPLGTLIGGPTSED